MSVLFVLTSHDVLGDTGRKTGAWLEEFLVPYYKVIDAGLLAFIATPAGGQAPIDPLSVDALRDTAIYRRFVHDETIQGALANTGWLPEITGNAYSAVIYPGGHGPLWDLRTNRESIALIGSMLKQSKPVATICHAGCALLEVRKPDGALLVDGLNVTSFSDSEEAAVGMVEQVPYLVESELRNRGARYTKAADWAGHAVRDGMVITGQNPASSAAVAEAVISLVK